MVPLWVASGAEAIFGAPTGPGGAVESTSLRLEDLFGPDGHAMQFEPKKHGALLALRVPLLGGADFFTSFK
jgi:hypothetical protein